MLCSCKNKKSFPLKIRKSNYIAYDLGDLRCHLDVWSVELCIIHVGVLHIFSIRNLIKETVWILKNKLPISHSLNATTWFTLVTITFESQLTFNAKFIWIYSLLLYLYLTIIITYESNLYNIKNMSPRPWHKTILIGFHIHSPHMHAIVSKCAYWCSHK